MDHAERIVIHCRKQQQIPRFARNDKVEFPGAKINLAGSAAAALGISVV